MWNYFSVTVEIMRTHPLVAWTVLILCSLTVGSFLNVLIVRCPQVLKREWWQEATEWMQSLTELEKKTLNEMPKQFNLCFPASHCVHCHHSLKIWHNIPVLSFIMLRGRCAFCRASIAWRYPVIELLAVGIACWSVHHWGWTLHSASATLLGWLLLVMSVIDFDEQLLPDRLTFLLLWIGLLQSTFNVWISPTESIVGASVGYLSLWLLTGIFNRVTGKQGMGAGDFKLFAALGAWFGISMLPLMMIMASMFGLIYGVSLMVIRKEFGSLRVPFGPFLALAAWFALNWGDNLLNMYLQWPMLI